MVLSSFTATLKEVLTPRFFITVTLFTLFYILLQIYLFNFRLINQTLIGEYPFSYKFTLLYQLIKGFYISFPPKETIFTSSVALLAGMNIALLFSSVTKMKKNQGSLKMSFGGVSVLALASSGCPSCGITILSILGPASGPFTLFLHNSAVQVGIISLLFFSLFTTLKQYSKANTCEIPINARGLRSSKRSR